MRKGFTLEYGGMCQEFRGWGGEDSGWLHKARVLGRAAITELHDQHLYHLYHPLSGGYAARDHIAANPNYANNVALLQEIRSIKNPHTFLRRFPPPARYTCPWELSARALFLCDGMDVRHERLAAGIAAVLSPR